MKKQGESRKHHLVPAFYLAGFTVRGSKNALLHVWDFHRAKRYPSTPRKACRETDFYRIEEPGLDPNYVEQLFARHEATVAPFIEQIRTNRGAANKREVGETLALAAVIFVRTRWAREAIELAVSLGLAKKLRRNEVTRDQWNQLRAAAIRDGVPQADVPSFGNALERARTGYWRPPVPSAIKAGALPELQETVMEHLHERPWELHITDATDHAGFITSASPLASGDLERALAGGGQGLFEADEITFPVSRHAALVSHRGARNGNCTATDEVVAHVNARTLHMSDGLVFFGAEPFLLERGTGNIETSEEFFRVMADARRRGILRL